MLFYCLYNSNLTKL